ncbi:MAG: alpha/beta hydrolase [Candidatus Heimdallarchaeota archaeon]
MVFRRLSGFRSIQRKIEGKLIQLAFIPAKYFESLYVECSTKITCHSCDICEMEEIYVRADLLKLMKEGQVDTQIEIEKFQLFERINSVSTKSKEIRVLMNEYRDEMTKDAYDNLVTLLKEISSAGHLMHQSIKSLYSNYNFALDRVEELNSKCNTIIDSLFDFKYCKSGESDYGFESPEILIGNALRSILQDIINVGEKIVSIVKLFSYNHRDLLLDSDETETQPDIIKGAEPFRFEADGPKVLLIHGFTASPTEMLPIGKYLHKKGYDVHSVLLAGHGTTPEDLQTKKKDDWWLSVRNVFKKTTDFDYVIGFSMGALLAARAAVVYRNQLKGVVIISPFLKIKPKIISKIAFLFPLAKYFKPYFSKSAETEQFFKDNKLISYVKYPMSAVHEAVKLSKYTERKILRSVKIPTLVIQGEKDDRVDPENYKIVMDKIKTEEKEVVLLPNSEHIVTVGPDKKLLMKSIKVFLEKYQKKKESF